MVQRAVLDYLGAEPEHRRSARTFLFSDNPERSDFRLICELLFTNPNLVVERVRDGLRDGTLRPTKVAAPE